MAPSTMVPVEARASKKPGISVEYGVSSLAPAPARRAPPPRRAPLDLPGGGASGVAEVGGGKGREGGGRDGLWGRPGPSSSSLGRPFGGCHSPLPLVLGPRPASAPWGPGGGREGLAAAAADAAAGPRQGLEIQDAATGAVQAVIHTHDCIEMLGEGGGDNSYGLVVSMFQRKVATSVEVRVAWFYRYQDTVEQGWKVGDAKASGHNGMEARREIFLTFHLDTVPAESIVGKADIFVCPADAAAPEAKAAIQKSFGGGQGYFWCHEVFNFKTMEPLALEAYREKAKGLEKACIDGAIARAEEAVADWGAGAGAKRGAGPPEGAGLDWTAGLRDDSGKRPNFGGGGGAAQGGTSGAALNGEPADSSAGTRFPSAGKEEELWFEAAAEGFDEVLKEAMAGSKGSLKSLKSKIDALSTVPSGHKLSHIGTVAAEIIAQGTQGAEEGAASACREVSETGVIELMSERLKIVSNKSLANGSEERHAEDDEVASILEALCKLPLNLSTYQWLKQNEIGYTIRDIAKDYNTVPKRLRKLAQDVKEHWGHYITSLFPNDDVGP